jgi:hypothetical protein
VSALSRLADGRAFPTFEGAALSWSLGLYDTPAEAERDFPRMRAVVRAMLAHRPEQLARERRDLSRACLGRMFGHNARRVLAVVDAEVLAAAGPPAPPAGEAAAYYVSALDPERPGAGYVLLAGPFVEHGDALACVDQAARRACDVDPHAPWYAYGTCRTAVADAPKVAFPDLGRT